MTISILMNQPFPGLTLPGQLVQAGVDLHEFGVHETAWSRSDALAVIGHLTERDVPVLGGDVVSSVRPLTYANANWHTERLPNETAAQYATRSQRESREYIEGYSKDTAWFVLVLGEPEATVSNAVI